MSDSSSIKPRSVLTNLFDTAVCHAQPQSCLAQYLPDDTHKPALVIGAGKAAAAMAASLEQHWQGPLSGLVVTRYGHGVDCSQIEVIEAAHPLPDSAGQIAATRITKLVEGLTAEDTVIVLLSGGGSALLAQTADSIELEDKQALTYQLLKCGASIDEINCVRKHLSAIKGGRLAAACAPAKVLSYAISDVPGDDPSVIASGPTVADPSTSAEALAILQRYHIDTTATVLDWLNSADSETPKPGDPIFKNSHYQLIATPQQALDAAAQEAKSLGLNVLMLGDQLEGEARELAREHAQLALSIKRGQHQITAPCVILSGGETTVTVKGSGRGGRNAEYLLSLACELQGEDDIYALAADTDGIDGSEDNAGALLSPQSYIKAQQQGLELKAYLDNNDAYSFFAALDDLLITGPTRTNVNDFRAILVV